MLRKFGKQQCPRKHVVHEVIAVHFIDHHKAQNTYNFIHTDPSRALFKKKHFSEKLVS